MLKCSIDCSKSRLAVAGGRDPVRMQAHENRFCFFCLPLCVFDRERSVFVPGTTSTH